VAGACSFDAHGGMVNFPSGHCAFRFSAATGMGELYDCGGQLTRTIGGTGQEEAQQQQQEEEDDVELLLDAHLVSLTRSMLESAGARAPCWGTGLCLALHQLCGGPTYVLRPSLCLTRHGGVAGLSLQAA
jgi:hypothetical protein